MNAATAPLPTTRNAEPRSHEPSMEEILASIRRIIADDQALPISPRMAPAKAAAAVMEEAAPVAEARVVRAASALTSPDESIAEFQAELAVALGRQKPAAPPVVVPDDEEPAPSTVARARPVISDLPRRAAPAIALDQSDVGLNRSRMAAPVELDTGAQRVTALRSAPPAPVEVEPEAEDEEIEETELAAHDLHEHDLHEDESHEDEVEAEALHEPEAVPEDLHAEEDEQELDEQYLHAEQVASADMDELEAAIQKLAPKRASTSITDDRLEDHAVEPEAPVARPSAFRRDPAPAASAPRPEMLLSPAADASITSSFQALTTTMFLQNSDLVERSIRELLKPMLKQWLDDNLPVTVERLVRAEIERVARGGR